MEGLFLLPAAMKRDPAIGRWFAEQRDDFRPLAETWFARMRQCGDDVRELFHDGRPTVCVRNAAFAYVGAYKEHVTIGFFTGATLSDPAGVLEGTGKRMRHVKIRPGDEGDTKALVRLIASAYADVRTRLAGQKVRERADR
jgi:hypothetical protein